MKRFMASVALLFALVMFIIPSVTQAACTQAISIQAKALWLGGAFSLGDTYKVAFFTDTATWSSATDQYAVTNEVSGTGYTAGGFTLGALTIAIDTATAYMDWPDEVNNNVTFSTASTCLLIYDDTLANTSCAGAGDPWECCSGASAGTCTDAILGVWTFSSIQPSDGTLTVTFPAPAAATAIIRIAEFEKWEDRLWQELAFGIQESTLPSLNDVFQMPFIVGGLSSKED